MQRALGIWFPTEGMPAAEAAAFARRIEDLVYAAPWVGETFGRDPFVHLTRLGQASGHRNAWKRLEFSEAAIDARAPRFLDAIVAPGDETALRERIGTHLAAGDSCVLLHPLHPEHGLGLPDWKVFEARAPQA